MASHAPDTERSMSGLTESEARAFNKVFVASFSLYVAVAVVAHILAWMWRPWGI